jgi:hypothetical protein
VIIDYQPNQINTVKSMDAELLVRNIVSVARLGKAYGLPIVLSTVNADAGQGLPALKDVLSDNVELDRTQINSWEDVELRKAVEATGRKTPGVGFNWTDTRRARMKAISLLEYGGPLVFNDVPTPTIARDEILVKVESTAVNHLDLVEASGTARQILPIDLPWIPGHELSGIVEQVGGDVAGWAPGDAVFGLTGRGAYAEYLAVKPATLARKPSTLSFEEAASTWSVATYRSARSSS